ncbi:MAG: polymer-forming cytoskeletal protein [Candidatus Sericytochromatia bacterium]|nr:polymer-forming cytoskeletal protein [Candidatus Sericytochromatia bacterium]
MKHPTKRQRGYALITAMAIGLVGLTITSVVMLRMMNATGQITQRERTDQAVFMAESVANHVVDKIADLTAQPELGPDDLPGIYTSGAGLMDLLHNTGNDFMDLSANTTGDIVFSRPASLPNGYAQQRYNMTSNAQAFFNSLNTDANHSKIFWERFQASNQSPTSGTVSSLLADAATIQDTLNELHQNFYSIYHVKKGNQEADVRVSVIPLATDIEGTDDDDLHTPDSFANHHDVLKIQVEVFIPSISNPSTQKTLDVIVNRPVLAEIPQELGDFSVLADGSIDMGNQETSAGLVAGVIDTNHDGSLHSNASIVIGTGGNVRGKVTAVGTVNVGGNVNLGTGTVSGGTDIPDTDFVASSGDVRESSTVTDRITNAEESQSGMPEQPIPKFSTDNLPTTPCTPAPGMGVNTYSDCVFDASLSVPSMATIAFSGTVHIQGSVDNNTGNFKCLGDSPCRMVIDDTFDQSGNGSTGADSESDMLIIVRNQSSDNNTCVDIGGTFGDAGEKGVLIHVEDPTCQSQLRGNASFYGSIITKGTFKAMGKGASDLGIQRAVGLDVSDFIDADPVTKDKLFPKVVVWKNRR